MFFKAIAFELTKDCITTRQAQLCNTQSETLKIFINGVQEQDFANYKPKDLDKILVSYGSENPAIVRGQYETITSQACIYSEKCPAPPGFVLTPDSCGS